MNLEKNRKVGRHHLAFYRGWLQGLDIGDMGDRYLESGLDLRRAKTTLRWLRTVIQQAALRHGKHSMARLLRLQIKAAAGSGADQEPSPLPSLDQFREEIDPDGFYTEKELIQCYTDRYPQAVDSKARQRQNLIDRQLRALSWIEELLATQPQPADPVNAWFDSIVADRLRQANIPTLLRLTDRIKDKGYRWWKTVPRLGEKGAARIVLWLQTYEDSLGVLPDHCTQPIRQYSSTELISQRPSKMGIVPLEKLLVPSNLDGSNGVNRYATPPKIEAFSDIQAIDSFLSMKSSNKNTQISYRMEAERLLLWAIMERQKALSDLSVDDCAAYRDWIAMLGRTENEAWPYRIAQSEWMKQDHAGSGRYKEKWRPFVKPLSSKSIKRALGILSAMFDWLVKVQYLAFNPWSAVPMVLAEVSDKPPALELQRMLTEWQVQYMEDYLESRGKSQGTDQLKFALPFAIMTGMRRSELVHAKIEDLYSMPKKDEPGLRWTLNVLGKRSKWRAVPIPDSLMNLLSNYLVARGLNPLPKENPPSTPLIASQRNNRPITQDALYKIFKGLFAEIAAQLDKEGRRDDATVFSKASTHWMRHTCGSYLASKNVPAVMIQSLLGHATLSSTSIYTHAPVESLWSEMSKNVPFNRRNTPR